MTHEPENGEGEIDESGRNLTQQELDEQGTDDVPVDAGWQQVPAERDDSAIGGGDE